MSSASLMGREFKYVSASAKRGKWKNGNFETFGHRQCIAIRARRYGNARYYAPIFNRPD
jgi:hypothetical protein